MPDFKIQLRGRIPDTILEQLRQRVGVDRLTTIVVDAPTASQARALIAQQTGIPFALLGDIAPATDTDRRRADAESTSGIRTLESISGGGGVNFPGVPFIGTGDPREALGPTDIGGIPGPFLPAGLGGPGPAPTPVPPFVSGTGVGEGEEPFGGGSISPPIRFGPTNPLPGQDQPFIEPGSDVVTGGDTAVATSNPFQTPPAPGDSAGSPQVDPGSVLGDDAYDQLQAILQIIGGANIAADLLSQDFLALLNNDKFLITQRVPDGQGGFIETTQLHPLAELMQSAWETKLEELGRQGDNEAQIAIEQIRQAPFGVLIDEDTAVRLTEEATRAGVSGPFGALTLQGASVDQILEGISRQVDELRGLPPEEREFRLQITRLQQQPQLQQQFLDFIGDSSAVGTAVGLGFNPFGQQQPERAQPDQPAPFTPPGAGRPQLGPSDPAEQGGFDPGLAFLNMFNDPNTRIDLPFLSQGSFRGAGANTNLNELRDRSQEELQFLTGQAAARGETPSGFERRVRSNTQQGV